MNIPATSFGLPGPTTPGPAVAATIGIQNKFELDAGDSIASTNFFVSSHSSASARVTARPHAASRRIPTAVRTASTKRTTSGGAST